MTKIVLLRPPEFFGETSFAQIYTLHESLGIGYLAASLRKSGHPVLILDAHIEGLSVDQTIERIASEDFDILGITIGSSLVIPHVIQIIQAVKGWGKNIHITIGGHYATFCYETLLKNQPGIDSIVRFEGEETILELAEAIRSAKDLENVKGIAFRRSGQIQVTAMRPLVVDLDALPFPSRDTLPALLKRGGLPLISGSRGCPASCSFCSVHSFYDAPPGKIWRGRSIENIIAEIKYLQDTFGCKELWFVDDNFLGYGKGGRKRAKNLFEAMDQEGLTISRLDFACRADSLVSDPDILKLAFAKRRGQVYPGIEAGVQRILDLYKKGTTIEENRVALNAIADSRGDLRMEFILFNPWITFDELKESIAFLEEMKVYNPYVLTSTLTIMRHTPLAASIEKGLLRVKPLPQEELEIFDTDSFIPYQLEDEQARVLFQLVTSTLPQLEYVLSGVNDLQHEATLKCNDSSTVRYLEIEEDCQDLTQFINETALDIFKEAIDWVEKDFESANDEKNTDFRDELIKKSIRFSRSIAGMIELEMKEFLEKSE